MTKESVKKFFKDHKKEIIEGTRNGKRIRLMRITSEPNLVILFLFRDKYTLFNEGE